MAKKILVIFVLFCFGFIFLYILKIHELAVHANSLFEYRCLHVNPSLISYKKAFLNYADFINTYPNTKYTPDEVQKFIDGYISGMRAYMPEETKWLDMQLAYINRWDFQLFEPLYIKDMASYQWKMYEGYRDDASGLLYMFDHQNLTEQITPQVEEARGRRDTYGQKYFDSFNKASQIHDWRKFFSNIPVPKGCTKDKMFIPNTSGSINWGRHNNESTPSAVPIDPYGLS